MYKMIVGLGNPGAQYEGTRHNAGFLALGLFAEKFGARYWKSECGAAVAHVRSSAKYADDELILAMPQSFMNTSGGPVSKLASQYKIKPQEIIVIHDDLDLEPGRIRIKTGGGHGGHNGLKSINAKLGSNEYARVKIGVGHPSGRKPVADYVLQVPKGEQATLFEDAILRASEAVEAMLAVGATKAMNTFN